MNPFAGIVTFGDRVIDAGCAARVTSIVAARGAGRPRLQRSPHGLLVQAGPPSGSPAPSSGRLFAATARLHNGAELAEDGSADEAAILERQLEHGDEGLARLLGAFAFAQWDEQAGELTLVRDYNGERPLFFHRGDGFVAFASYLPDLLALPEVPRRLDETMMAQFLALNHREYERTFYVGVDRVPTRTRVTITRDGVRMRRYWSPNLHAPAPCRTDDEYVERARELFDRAVARCLKDTPRVAILTSGGFDSSAVAATAARLGHGDATCYTGVPPPGFDRPANIGRYADERPKVEALGRMHPSLRIRYVAPEGAHPRQEDGAGLFAQVGLPMRNPCNLGWFSGIDDAIKADGHGVIFTGARGNMGLTWSGRGAVGALAAKGRLGRMISEARGVAREKRQPLWRVLGAEALHAAPLAIQDRYLRLRGWRAPDIDRYSLLSAEATDRLDLRQGWRDAGFDPGFRPTGGPARHRAHQAYDQLQLARDAAAMAPLWRGAEVRDPHADRELMAFCLAVPEEQYQRDGVERWFARQVLADRLPADILNERLRGEQAPNWFDALDARKASVAEDIARIEASPLGARLIDLERLKRLYDQWPASGEAARSQTHTYRLGLSRAIHIGQFIRWVEGGNA